LAGGATSSATAEEGSSPSQDRSVDFLQKHTQLVVSQTSTTTTSTTREDAVVTSSTGLLSRPGHQGCWRYRPVHPRRAPPPAPPRLPPPPQQWRPAQCSLALLKPPPPQRRRLQAPCSLEEQGANISSTVGAGLRLPAGSPTVSHMPSSPSSTGSVGGTSCIQGRLLISERTRTTGTRLLCSRQLTS
jgi:hypothetical protein